MALTVRELKTYVLTDAQMRRFYNSKALFGAPGGSVIEVPISLPLRTYLEKITRHHTFRNATAVATFGGFHLTVEVEYQVSGELVS